MLGDVRPIAAAADRRDGGLRHAEHGGDLALGQAALVTECAYGANGLLGEFSVRTAGAAHVIGRVACAPVANAWSGRAPLRGTVGIVVSDCASGQMGRVAARRVIAGVHDDMVNRWRSIHKVVGDAMCRQRGLDPGRRVSPAKASVAARGFGSQPLPALGCGASINSAPEVRGESEQVALLRHTHSLSRGVQ
jgi:hypothetical protein